MTMVFSLSLSLSLQSLLLSVWLHREKEVIMKPEDIVKNFHTLLIALSNMKGGALCVCVCVCHFFSFFACW